MVDKGFRLFKSVGQESIWKIPPGTLFVDPLQELQRKLGCLDWGSSRDVELWSHVVSLQRDQLEVHREYP